MVCCPSIAGWICADGICLLVPITSPPAFSNIGVFKF
jgi:hypothetical protein